MKVYTVFFEGNIELIEGSFIRIENDRTIIYAFEDTKLDEDEVLRMTTEVAIVPSTALITVRNKIN